MMNSNMDRSLLNLIMYKGFGNPKSYLRESLYRFIALNVWTQLVDAGISEIREKISEKGQENFSTADVKTWKIEVLMKILPVMYLKKPERQSVHSYRFSDDATDFISENNLLCRNS